MNNKHDEGADLPQISGVLTPEAITQVNNHQLIAGNKYSCSVCGQEQTAPFVYRCVCGLRICKNCASNHESSG